MAFNQQQQDAIFKKTDGLCHICRKKLARKNYGGGVNAQGAWEVDHSNPKAKGGTNHMNNFYPACISCNRSKQDASTKAARGKNGFKAAPLSREKRDGNIIKGAFGGALLGFRFGGVPGALIGAAIGTVIGNNYESD